MSTADRIVEYIRRNRVSTTEIADCLGKTGAIAGVAPITPGQFRVGPVFWVHTWDQTNWPVHEQIQNVPEGCVVVVSGVNCAGRALFGDLVSKYLLLYRQVAAIVAIGPLRDAHRLIKERWPVWCDGFNPVGCFNRPPKTPVDPDWKAAAQNMFSGAIAVCDDTGVVVIPASELTEEFIGKLEYIESQEDKWYECVDRLKWSTFQTVCLKEYLSPNESIMNLDRIESSG